MKQQDRIEILLRTVLSNQIKLAQIGYNLSCAISSTTGVTAILNEVRQQATDAIAFSKSEHKIK